MTATAVSTEKEPASRELPSTGHVAIILGYVLAVVLVLGGVGFFAQMSFYKEGKAAVKSTGGTPEMVIDGLVCLIAAALLVAGAVMLSRSVVKGRLAMNFGASLAIVLTMLWLGRVQKLDAMFLVAVPVLLAIITIALLSTPSVQIWNAGGLPAGYQSTTTRISLSWNSLARPQQWGFTTIVIAILIIAPFLSSNLPVLGSLSTEPGTDFGIALFNAARYALIAVGLNVVVGQAGLLDLGYVGFFAVGAYVTALLTSSDSTVRQFTDPRWAWLACVPLAMGVTMIFGLVLGGPTLRLRGDYLAIVTLGFGEIVRLVADNVPPLRGQSGFQDVAGPPGHHETKAIFTQTTDGKPFFYLTVGIIILVLLLVGNLERSRVGRAWVAIRDDEDAAEIMGVPTFKFKLWAFVMGAAIGGISGAIYAGQIGFVNNQKFDPVTSILFLAAVVLGGAGNKVGVLVGAFLISYIPDRFTSIAEDKYLIFGIALIALMIFRPQGLLGARQRLLTFGRSAYRRITGGPERLDTGTGAFSTDVKSGTLGGRL
jgi:branched-chain amino acid transport system permease protein